MKPGLLRDLFARSHWGSAVAAILIVGGLTLGVLPASPSASCWCSPARERRRGGRAIPTGLLSITEWFVSWDALNFDLIQAVIGILLVASMVGILAVWPKRWSQPINRVGRRPAT